MSKPVVLIIEDEPDVLKMLASILQRQNIEVVKALGGTQALKALETTRPDVILLDLAMPGISGLDILDNIKQQPHLRDVSILVITARPQMAQEVHDNYLVDKIFMKPVQASVLIRTIKEYL